ncbi:thiol reductant ABC exporter subunit CydD [Desulfitobacterium sp.]|uniref:thiol reductant ABC exporter subunit CydD n=1 Tax=Desulfitobacterium sp. TaxID=49981 RepID=UPI002B1F3446|nr:thiol reductant ABC exporter subunit CydD [Desulfitobacterium sp.]MEA4903154.1 thiol reductant ABC exporter subunit CydD [Desulfitobacterium sp.]
MIDKRLLRASRRVSSLLIVTVILGIVAAGLAVAQAYALSHVVAEAFLNKAVLTSLWTPLVWILGIILLRGVVQWLSAIVAQEAAIRVKENIREQFLKALIQLGPLYARGERAGELVNTAVEGIESLEDYFARYLPQLAMAGLIPLFMLFYIFPLDYQTALVLLVTGPIIPVFMMLIGKLAEKKSLQQWRALSWMSAHFLDMLQGLATLKVFGRSKDQARVIGRVSESFRKTTLSVLRIAFLSALVLEFMTTISTALVAVALGVRLVYGKIIFEEALFLLVITPEFYLPLRNLGLRFHASLSGVNAANRIYEVLNQIENLTEDTEDLGNDELCLQSGSKPSELELAKANIIFRNVSLVYDADGLAALDGVDLEIRPGEHVALVGPSGAGKSTVFSLLMHFIKPTKGEIIIAGTPLEQLPAAQWRSQIAYLSQQPYLFSGTIEENIRLARPEALDSEVREAAEKAAAHEFIMTFPNGYQTLVGEGGARLSGGQAQRIAIARAFLKNASLLLLDEATEGLDAESEHVIQDSLSELMKGRTVLMIAHRLNTVCQADRILVLDHGKIAETGSHQELLQRQGLYAQFVREYRGETA